MMLAGSAVLGVAIYGASRTIISPPAEPAAEQPPGDTFAEAPDAKVATEEPGPSSLNLHQWGALTLIHGLPSDHVRAITQDSEGTLWFATDNGLARYDGRRIQKVS